MIFVLCARVERVAERPGCMFGGSSLPGGDGAKRLDSSGHLPSQVT